MRVTHATVSPALPLYRAIDSNGDTVEFWFSERRDLIAAKRFLRKALKRHGRPERIVIDGSQTNREAILSCDAESRLQDRSRRRLKPIRGARKVCSTNLGKLDEEENIGQAAPDLTLF